MDQNRTGNVGPAVEAKDRSSWLAGQETANDPTMWRADDAAVSGEADDEPGRSHIKRRVEEENISGRGTRRRLGRFGRCCV